MDPRLDCLLLTRASLEAKAKFVGLCWIGSRIFSSDTLRRVSPTRLSIIRQALLQVLFVNTGRLPSGIRCSRPNRALAPFHRPTRACSCSVEIYTRFWVPTFFTNSTALDSPSLLEEFPSNDDGSRCPLVVWRGSTG